MHGEPLMGLPAVGAGPAATSATNELPHVLPSDAPHAEGWGAAAMAIHAIRRMPVPVLLRIDLIGTGAITIDPRVPGYGGGLQIIQLADHPRAVVVETHAATEAPTTQTGDLEGLLWFIGERAFGEQPATWLWPGDRFRLTRWPSVAQIAIGLDEIRIFAALGAAHLNAAELANAAQVAPGKAQRAINALSLMGLLDNASSAPPPTPMPPRSTPASGLFGRLRQRLGL